MWNDTDTPLAYLITFRCYGTWLHGDERGSIDRFHNKYKSPYLKPNQKWLKHNTESLRREPVSLNSVQRNCVEKAIRQTCDFRKWILLAINVRTNHVHIVVTASHQKPETVLSAFKANATKQTRDDNCRSSAESPWAEKGSKKRLWNEQSIAQAIDYVLNGQGGDLPDFD